MKTIKILLFAFIVGFTASSLDAQVNTSTATLRRGSRNVEKTESKGISNRQQQRLSMPSASDSELGWMRVVYRQLDLAKEGNAPLYYPEPPLDGRTNFFRTVFDLVLSGKVNAYEYMDGREVFTKDHLIAPKDILERFHIKYDDGKESGKRKIRHEVAESDVPSEEVQSYYIIERYEFDRKNTRMRIVIEAVCPVLHRTDEWDLKPLKYPMFWVKYNDLRPYIADEGIILSENNNLQSCSFDDFFLLGMYDGEIVKTKNPLNKSLAELYPDEDTRKRVQDSIQHSLDSFGGNLWVPSMDELQKRREQKEKAEILAAGGDTTIVTTSKAISTKRGAKKQKSLKIKTKRAKAPKAKSASTATRSVRNRRR